MSLLRTMDTELCKVIYTQGSINLVDKTIKCYFSGHGYVIFTKIVINQHKVIKGTLKSH